MAGEGVQLFEVGVGESQYLGQECVDANVVRELAAKVLLLFLRKGLESIDYRRERGIELVLRSLAIEVDLGEGVDVCVGVYRVAKQSRLDFVENIGVCRLRENRRLVIGFERGPYLIGLIGEVEHHRASLLGLRAIQARQRLHCVDSTEFFVDVHRVQQWLIEAGLKFLSDDQKSI